MIARKSLTKERFMPSRSLGTLVLNLMERFYVWSGLKINVGKTYETIFGREFKKPRFVDELKIKWCNDFKLLGIHFDVTLSNMQKKLSNRH